MALAFADARGIVMTTGTGDLPRMWDLASGKELPLAKIPRASCPNSSISPDGGRILAVSWDGFVSISRVADGEIQPLRSDHEGGVLDMAWSPDGRGIALATYDFAVRVWDASDSQ
jgi:WD40 repeat protein